MFDPAYTSEPPEWDPERRYRPDSITLFLQVEACDAISKDALLGWYLGDSVPEGMADQDAGPLPEGYWAKKPRFSRVPLDHCLLEALQTPGYVVPGTPAPTDRRGTITRYLRRAVGLPVRPCRGTHGGA